MAMPPRSVAKKYELVRLIGHGAMGEIWEALDHHLRRRVALKLMAAEMGASKAARLRFDREARAIAQLQSAHVVQIYDYGIDGGSPYIVMELLVGEDLEARLEREQRLSLAALAPLVAQTALALGAAHAKGIIHRDLKPANIFLARSGAAEVVKVLDFGVVSMLHAGEGPLADDVELTAAGSAVGTPLYMSPEQIRDGPIDHRSDLWSLGVLIYRALVGQPPFSGPWLGNLMVRICTDPFPPASSLLGDLPAAVDAFFARALAKDPKQRFTSAKDLATAFTSLAEGAGRGPAKLLVVDDEPDVAVLIKQRFRRELSRGTYSFIFASDGEQALSELRRHPDVFVILSDISMPKMDGLTLLGRVAEEHPLVRTIILSAHGDMRNIRSAMNRGAFDFLVKPIDLEDLALTIDKTLRHVRELRRTVRSSEEHSALRMFVGPGALARVQAGGLSATHEAVVGTLVLADVVGEGILPPDTTPEDRLRALNANLEVIVPAITARGGAVDKFLGSAVLAVFRGDDHARWALEACLDLRIQLRTLALRAGEGSPFGIGVAIGVVTGELLFGEIGSQASGRLDYAVVGAAPRAVAALAAAAGRNRIFVDAATVNAVRDAFQFAAPDPSGDAELLRRVRGPAERRPVEPHADTASPDEVTIEFEKG